MKNRYIPLEKRSKRQQRNYHLSHRKSWGGINPITRKSDDPKVYNRKKNRHTINQDGMSDFLSV